MDIQVGDRVTYEYDNEEIIELIISKQEIINIKNNIAICKIKNLKIERPKYEVVEEHDKCKELLTEEEREFLRLYIKYNMYNKAINSIEKCSDSMLFYNKDNSYICVYNYSDTIFKNLETSRGYTLSELGLEE